MITGEITAVAPKTVIPGERLRILVSIWARSDNKWLLIPAAVWATRLEGVGNGTTNRNEQIYASSGLYVSRIAEELDLGIMPDRPVSIIVRYTGNEWWPQDKWVPIVSKSFTINPDRAIIPTSPVTSLIPGVPAQAPDYPLPPLPTLPAVPAIPPLAPPGLGATGEGFSGWLKNNQTSIIIAGIAVTAAVLLSGDKQPAKKKGK